MAAGPAPGAPDRDVEHPLQPQHLQLLLRGGRGEPQLQVQVTALSNMYQPSAANFYIYSKDMLPFWYREMIRK